MPPRRYVAYARVSTTSQGESGLGLEAQESAVRSFIAANGGSLISTFIEIESGRNNARERLREAFSACRIHKAVLLVAKLDRLGRDAGFLLGLERAGVDFVCCDNPFANRLTLGVLAVVAEEEAKAISQRTRAALAAARARGTRLGRPENLKSKDRMAGNRASIRSRQAAAVARAHDLAPHISMARRNGASSYSELAEYLNNCGIPTTRGCRWTPAAARRAYLLLQSIAE